MQKTKVAKIYTKINDLLFGFLSSSWQLKSFNIFSLLFGYFVFTNLITNIISRFNNKSLIVPLLILFFELIIRLKPNKEVDSLSLWRFFDRLRIGAIYALILEAFKLGS